MSRPYSVIDPNPRAIRNSPQCSRYAASSVIDPNPRAIRNISGTAARQTPSVIDPNPRAIRNPLLHPLLRRLV